MPFVGRLLLEPLPPKIVKKKFLWLIPYTKLVFEFKVCEDFVYVDNKLEITTGVSAGTMTDFASIPRILWPILPPWGRYGWAAVIHDDGYRHGKFDRKTCDLLFLHAMEELNVAKWKRYVMYKAVRRFGKSSYKGGTVEKYN